MRAALVCIDPRPEEYDACLQVASFAVAALASPGRSAGWDRVSIAAPPAAALEVLLAALDVIDRATVEGGERRRSPLRLLSPFHGRSEDLPDEMSLLPTEDDEPWTGTLADLERAGVIEPDPGEGEAASPGGGRRFAPGDPVSVVQAEIGRYAPTTIVVLGGRPGIWDALQDRPGIITFGSDARDRRGRAAPDLKLVDEVDAATLMDGELAEIEGEGRESALDGAKLGAQIGLFLEELYLLDPDPDDRARR